jgi:hypothetical protein
MLPHYGQPGCTCKRDRRIACKVKQEIDSRFITTKIDRSNGRSCSVRSWVVVGSQEEGAEPASV